jgi:SAM-dependent methyltransferase
MSDEAAMMTWEQAVQYLRTLPEHKDLVRDAYLDEDIMGAAKRFHASEEYREVLTLIGKYVKKDAPWDVLDVGAGNGIASYAFASEGHRVFALEPDESDDVGAGAIEKLCKKGDMKIEILRSQAEKISLADGSIDVAYVRQALHHAGDLPKMIGEVARVLREDGCLIACREHVVDNDDQLKVFLETHPLHKFYGGEHAYPLDTYTEALTGAGLQIKEVLGPYDSVINYAPIEKARFRKTVADRFRRFSIQWMMRGLFSVDAIWNLFAYLFNSLDRNPGRLYSFLAVIPRRIPA